MRHDDERRPEEIEAEIERTRASMDATLSAIEQRLTPGQLLDQGLDYMRHSGANEFVNNLGEQVRHNPLPVTLMGIGLAWLMMNDRQWHAPPAGPGMRERAAGAMHRVSGAAESVSEGMRSASRSAEDAMSRVSGAADAASHRLSEAAHATREKFAQAASAAREQAHWMGETSRRQYERARGSYQHMLREEPLALGAVGLAVGALIAAAIPRTRREDELMGEARDRLAEQAKEAGREQLHKAERVATAAGQAAVGEAERQGLTGSTPQGAAPTGAGTTRSQPGKPAAMEPSDPFACPATEPPQPQVQRPGPGR